MEEDRTLDEQYKTGIWYDTYNGDFCEIQNAYNDKGHEVVELVNPENDSVYHEMPLHEWKDYERYEFRQVLDDAVSDPVGYVRGMMHRLTQGDQDLSEDESIALGWAYEQVEISEA